MANGLDPRLFAEILDGLYRGVEDPDCWSDAVFRIGEALRAPVIARHSFDLVRKVGVAVSIRGLSPALEEAYKLHYCQTNIWMGRARGRISVGGIVVSDDLAPEGEVLQSEWHEGFLRPLGIYRSMGAVLAIEEDVSSTILFGRPRSHGVYTDEDRRLLHSFVPHLQNVNRFRKRMASLDAVRSSLSAAIDALGHGVLLGEPNGRVSFLNPAAERILAFRDGLTLKPEGLRATVPSEDARLRRAISQAATGAHKEAPCGELLKISRPSGSRPFEVLVMPLTSAFAASGPQYRGVLVLLHDPEATPHSPLASLRSAFGLTPAEARVAELLADGTDLVTVAARLEIAIDTARTHLKRIFAKTNTHRQAQLARLLAGSLSRVAPP